MASPRRRNVASDICRLLREDHHPRSYCDACLALRFGVSLEQARAAAIAITDGSGFVRQLSTCDTCTRTVEVTSMGVRLRRP